MIFMRSSGEPVHTNMKSCGKALLRAKANPASSALKHTARRFHVDLGRVRLKANINGVRRLRRHAVRNWK